MIKLKLRLKLLDFYFIHCCTNTLYLVKYFNTFKSFPKMVIFVSRKLIKINQKLISYRKLFLSAACSTEALQGRVQEVDDGGGGGGGFFQI